MTVTYVPHSLDSGVGEYDGVVGSWYGTWACCCGTGWCCEASVWDEIRFGGVVMGRDVV